MAPKLFNRTGWLSETWARYAFGTAMLIAALPVSWAVRLLTGNQFPFMASFLAVVLTAVFSGTLPAILIALAALALVQSTSLGPAPMYNVVLFIVGCTIALPLIRQLRVARTKAMELRRAEKESQQRLREANQQKDEFLAILAHELRNPLAPIRTATQILRMERATTQQREAAQDMILRQVNNMVRLIDDLLDVSRITGGKLELRKQRMDVAEAVNNAVETSRPLIDEQEQRLSISFPPTPVHIDGDLTRLAQVVANLLNNASRYSPRGTDIGLRVTEEDSWAQIEVTDQGIGIPEHLLTRIWQMFVQADKRLERPHGGLGIGLTLVQRIVQMHGGTVEAHSEGENRGSRFIVRLPKQV